MTTTTLTPRLIEKATEWGTFCGQDMARRQFAKRFPFFGVAEITINAKVSARRNARDYRVTAEQYAEWERVFVEQYSTAYTATVATFQTAATR